MEHSKVDELIVLSLYMRFQKILKLKNLKFPNSKIKKGESSLTKEIQITVPDTRSQSVLIMFKISPIDFPANVE